MALPEDFVGKAVWRKDRRLVAPALRVREDLTRGVAVLYVLVAAYYLLWRAESSLNLDALWLSIPLLLAEIQGFGHFLLFLHSTWRVANSDAKPKRLRRSATVDVFVTTYDEDVSLVRATALGALAIRYPHKTYILDDGRRLEMERLAKELRCGYIIRSDNEHAKAGNLNHALAHTSGEFIATFDADQVPHPNFLAETMGYFEDESVALVQTPQEFYNLDSFQHTLDHNSESAWHEQVLFYRVIQPGKDRLNSVFWCGTNAVLRRSALESVGGIATDSVTEDLHTSIRLHSAGWGSRYVNRVLATGIAPPDYAAFLTQRLRWAQGSMQLLHMANPLRVCGLTLSQRLSYLASMTTYLEWFQKLIYLSVPLVVLYTGILPIRNMGLEFLVRFVPYFALGLAANSLLARGYGRHLATEQYNLLKALVFAWSTLALFRKRPLGFRVTPKHAVGGFKHRGLDWMLLSPYLLLVGVSMLALVLVLLGAAGGPAMVARSRLAIHLTAAWALYNAGLMGIAARLVLGRHYRREVYRFPLTVPVHFAVDREPRAYVWSETMDLSQQGLAMITHAPLESGTPLRLRLILPEGPVVARGIATHASALRVGRDQAYRTGVMFTHISTRATHRLNRFLFHGPTGAVPVRGLAEAA